MSSRHPRSLLVALVSFGLVASTMANRARAGGGVDDRIVVFGGVTGPRGERVSEPIDEWLSDQYSYVGPALLHRTEARLGCSLSSPADVKAVLGALGATAIVSGTVADRDLILLVRDAGTGTVVDEIDAPIGRRGLAPEALAKVEARLQAAIAKAQGPGAASTNGAATSGGSTGGEATGGGPAGGEAGGGEATGSETQGEEGTGATGTAESTGGEMPAAGTSEGTGAGAGSVAQTLVSGPGGVAAHAITVALGFDAGSESIVLGGGLPSFSPGPTAGLHASVELNPFVATSEPHPSFLDHLGLAVEVENDASQTVAASNAPPVTSHAHRWDGALRIRLGAGPATLLLDGGYGERVLTLPSTAAAGYVPSLSYQLLLFRAGTLAPIGTRFAAGASLAYLPVLSTNPLPATRFDGTTAWGLEARAGGLAGLGHGFALGAWLSYTRFAVHVVDAQAPTGGGPATDSRIGLSAALAYSF